MNTPTPNGRDGSGRFAPGNTGGPGNPHAASVARLRAAMLGAVEAGDVADVVKALVALAKGGNVAAAREVLDRTLGKAEALDLLARLEALEDRIGNPASAHTPAPE
ncbi:MAG: hypothetical protein ACKVS8_10685 [Phycisphaerales bacterium]